MVLRYIVIKVHRPDLIGILPPIKLAAHNNFGRQVKLLANTTDPYSGRTLLPPDVLILTVKAVGDWTISLE